MCYKTLVVKKDARCQEVIKAPSRYESSPVDDDDDDDDDGLLCCDSVKSGRPLGRQRRTQSSVVPERH